ncbi:hypothetical protein [Sciscionella sediminilitoris]|uniref:hypothetical protein n=1 Tax=Sciscionella sediminilitoris TaxID=1445613 RepID=UPI0006924F71|nr:hypothetical protein [Sciscionella sp. SE31]
MGHVPDHDKPTALPTMIRAGPESASLILVLDPAGEASHGELPATWRPTVRHTRVVWYRLARRGIHQLLQDTELEQLLGGADRVHLAAAGAATEPALAFAATHTAIVRSLLLVDPRISAPPAEPDEDFIRRWAALLKASGIRVRVSHPHHVRPATEVAPLGLPEVVAQALEVSGRATEDARV